VNDLAPGRGCITTVLDSSCLCGRAHHNIYIIRSLSDATPLPIPILNPTKKDPDAQDHRVQMSEAWMKGAPTRYLAGVIVHLRSGQEPSPQGLAIQPGA